MFYMYYFIFFTNKCSNLYRQTHHMIDNIYGKKNNVLFVAKTMDISITDNHSLVLNNDKSYVVRDGFDTRYNISYDENEILNFMYNKQKLYIYHLLLSNYTSLSNKIYLVNILNDYSTKSKYTPSLFSGGFFKDSDFSSSDFFF